MMKQFWTAALILLGTTGIAEAQNYKTESAIIAYGKGDILEAKRNIDVSREASSTKGKAKTLYWTGKVYTAVAQAQQNEEIEMLDSSAGFLALKSFLDVIELEKDERRPDYSEAKDEVVMAVPVCYNYAYKMYVAGVNTINDGDKAKGAALVRHAIEGFNMILASYPYDSKNQISTVLNLPKVNVYQTIGDAANAIDDRKLAYEVFEKAMNLEESNPYAFRRSTLMYLEDKDTTNALKVVEKGLEKYPSNKDIQDLQFFLYEKMGKEDQLVDKINESLKDDPYNPRLLMSRGKIYDQRARKTVEKLNTTIEKEYEMQSSIRRERNAAKKKAMNAELDSLQDQIKSLFKKQQRLDSLAIVDYKKAYEEDPGLFELVFNLGANYYNQAVPLIQKANNLQGDKNYDKNYKELKDKWIKLYEESKNWFLLAEELKPDDDSVLLSLQQVYAQLGDEEKSMEYRDKRK